MNIGMYRAISGCMVQQEKLTTASINMANANTVGYKPARLSLSSQNNSVQVDKNVVDFSEGAKQNTFNHLDLALEGEGFFVVQAHQGLAYTRKGNFSLNAEGIMVTQEGMPVLGQNGTIRIQGNDFTVSGDGTIQVDGTEIDKLRLADFPRPYPFAGNSGTLFYPTTTEIQEQSAKGVVVRQGQLELSNTSLMEEMTRLIEISNNYESCQKVMQTVDEMDQKIINETRRE